MKWTKDTSIKFAVVLTFSVIVLWGQGITPPAVMDERVQEMKRQIADINHHIEFTDTRLSKIEMEGSAKSQVVGFDLSKLQERVTELEHNLYLWKGIVLGFGAIISFLELIQAIDAIRSRSHVLHRNHLKIASYEDEEG